MYRFQLISDIHLEHISVEKYYNIKSSPIDLEQLSKMTPELESLNKLVGLSNIKTQIVDLILYY